jgi:hypothetical protein
MIETLRIAVVALVLALPACRGGSPPRPTPGDPLLVEITAEVGLEPGPAWPDGTYFLPEITGPGIALVDFDGDGDLDLLQARMPPPGQPRAAAPNRFLRRNADGVFVDVTEQSGLGDPGFGQGIAVGDVDNDGDPDVYFANFGRDAFYRNQGDGTFTDETALAGIADERWSSAATFCDYDRDGDLDLYVVHYLNIDYGRGCRSSSGIEDYCGPGSFDGQADTLYRNDGKGIFTDVTDPAGIRATKGGKLAKGLGVVCLDLTGDGWPDIYVANDGEANQLWVGRPDGSFTDEAIMRGLAVNRHGKPEASMGLAVGDVDRDGHLDLLSTHLAAENNTLYLGGRILFRDRTVESGMTGHDLSLTGFGCALFDLEHDGDLDLAVVNGRVGLDEPRPSDPFWLRYAEPNLLFRNDGTGRFVDASGEAGRFASTIEVSRGLALGDLDGDGDLDLVVSHVDNSLRVYRNEAPPAGAHWLSVRALTGPRDALGSRVTLVLGQRRLVGPILFNSSYQSASDPRAHFGLGTTDTVDYLEVVWPDGQRERFPVPEVDRAIEVHQGSGEGS